MHLVSSLLLVTTAGALLVTADRWRPAITEFREVEGEAMMGRAAAHLMTTALPRGDTELMSASIRMPTGSAGDQVSSRHAHATDAISSLLV
jgi:hypothetical protein